MFSADWKLLGAAVIENCLNKAGTVPQDWGAGKGESESAIVWCKIGNICANYDKLHNFNQPTNALYHKIIH
jgi:hypothetical protein